MIVLVSFTPDSPQGSSRPNRGPRPIKHRPFVKSIKLVSLLGITQESHVAVLKGERGEDELHLVGGGCRS